MILRGEYPPPPLNEYLQPHHKGATSIVKIGEVRLSGEIRGGVEVSKKPNFRITIRYEIPTFSSVGPFFEGGEGSRKFRPEAEIFGIFSIEVAPYIYIYYTVPLLGHR